MVCEGSGENIFMVKDGKVYTPPQVASILDGISRKSVMQILEDKGFVQNVSQAIDETRNARDALRRVLDTYRQTFERIEDPYFREDPQHALFMDLLPVSHTRPPVPNGSKLWDMQYTAFRDEIPHGTKTPEEALKNIDDVINKELEEMGFFS